MSPVKIILASQSPRRQELLHALGIKFKVVVPEVEETYPNDIPSRKVPAFLSHKKAHAAGAFLKPDEVLIAADSLVFLENRILGKPASIDDAKQMLRTLSGRGHDVITGVTLKTCEKQITFSELTKVTFRVLSAEMIEFYINKFQPLDKAGAYGIQDWIGYVGIEKINGCFYNVMGLPVSRLVREMKKLGVDITNEKIRI